MSKSTSRAARCVLGESRHINYKKQYIYVYKSVVKFPGKRWIVCANCATDKSTKREYVIYFWRNVAISCSFFFRRDAASCQVRPFVRSSLRANWSTGAPENGRPCMRGASLPYVTISIYKTNVCSVESSLECIQSNKPSRDCGEEREEGRGETTKTN